ncbi:MAG: hypothetical protein KDE14_06605 [Rhodobacteraceae bacterium]|nr:hypothetical protein [Paracoccaceae bacterium]
MKVNRDKLTADRLEGKLQRLKSLLQDYEHNDVSKLSEIAEIIVLAYEYVFLNKRRTKSLHFEYAQQIFDYFRTVFCPQVVLLLKSPEGYWGYSRRNVLSVLRAINLHADEAHRSERDTVLKDFILDERNDVSMEFALTHCWLFTPGLSYVGGNKDTANPYAETIIFDGGAKKILSTIESIAIETAIEFFSLCTVGGYRNKKRIYLSGFDTQDELKKRIGEKSASSIGATIDWHRNGGLIGTLPEN